MNNTFNNEPRSILITTDGKGVSEKTKALDSLLSNARSNPIWQPIETAPKDGTVVLVYPGTWDYTASPARWDTDKYAKKPKPFWNRMDSITVGSNRSKIPTYWIPMPEPPQEGGGND